MSAPTIVDSPLETKPLVNPEWVDDGSHHRLYCEGRRTEAACVGQVGPLWCSAWHYGDCGSRLLRLYSGNRPLDECKAACEQALRDAGYRFAGEKVASVAEQPKQSPHPELTPWVGFPSPGFRSASLYYAGTGHLAATVDEIGSRRGWVLAAYRNEANAPLASTKTICPPSDYGPSLTHDEAREDAVRMLRLLSLIDAAPPAAPCSNPACDCDGMRPDDRIALPDADGIEVLPDGAKQSKLAERCDLLPPRAVLAVARVMHEGAAKYGERNWETIPASSHLNHAVRHVLLYLSGDRQEKHLEHAACRALMALDKYLRDADAPP